MSKLQTQIDKLNTAWAAARASLDGINAKLAELVPQREAELAAEQARKAIDVDGVPVGTQVTYEYGRAEKRRSLTGLVSAFNPETKQYRIMHGQGFDAELHTVPSAAITGVEG